MFGLDKEMKLMKKSKLESKLASVRVGHTNGKEADDKSKIMEKDLGVALWYRVCMTTLTWM